MHGGEHIAHPAQHPHSPRWVAEVCEHALFAGETNPETRTLQADALEQIGFGAENGTWRSAYLAGAKELRDGKFGTDPAVLGRLVALLAPVDADFAIVTP